MPVRDLTAEDFVGYRLLASGAFGGRLDPRSAEGPQDFSPGETALGIDATTLPGGVEGVIAAAARIRHDRIALGGGEVRCGGIGGLAVHPAHRGDGLFAELLTAVIARCQREGMVMSMLYPSNPAIYRGLGYQVVARGESLLVPLLDLQRLPAVPDRRLVPVTEESMPRLRRLHHELTAQDNGMLRREPPLFPETMPAFPWSALLLEDERGTAHGYVSWTRRSGESDGVGLEVHELFGRTRDDRRALLRSLGSWSTVTETLRLRLRTEDPVLDVLPSGGARPDPSAVPLVMMRVIDTAATLAARRAPASLQGSVRLVVVDDTVPDGTCRAAGTTLVSAAHGEISTLPVGEGGPQLGGDEQPGAEQAGTAPLGTVHLDIHAASLLLVGGRTLADARRLGLLAEAEPAAERFWDALLAGPRPSVLDAF